MSAVQREQRASGFHKHDYTSYSKGESSMHQTDATARPGSSSASENPHIANTYPRDWGYDGNIEVVKPYAIEEPEDEAPKVISRLTLSEPPSEAELWQGELVESMEDLHCDSDHNGIAYHPNHRRGKKRKSPTFAPGSSGSVRRETFKAASEMQDEGPSLSPKRLHRRSKRSRKELRASWSIFSERGVDREAESSSSFSPSAMVRDASETSPTNNADATDEMDIE
ncbi:uncharacterized protein ACLA_036850 [Aspergillus clavatus NRRL 1]|uniref:Uncharacterized protein n=1 Tax=Aspergillus clavatus (strain ATCC 1007 / CBS 513.65 / DSM 816 / NCTC 3887 / NRRL 1 / QM 1276 / 107) TaxID=344612 RepID=A1CK06_ASPCL|nr:uncharacterized protein ACLA_036850 [Aspergillus clavatus NRRL 1]EAW09480.1 hypothetical protein ACLA_036850 [Aspergillus clavatus NRRL 1]